ncbi:MAG: CoA transferase [Sphingomonas bacterium]|nr:CoA transferase [Sphingomonas bacterium]
MTRALEGIRILDLSHALAAPSATKLLGDYGAEVIKIEPPGKGDFTRALTPGVFEAFNCNKKSLAVDLKAPEGLGIVHDLARISDIVVEAFRPGVVDKLGIGRSELTALNPRLIYVSFSAFGQKGGGAARRGVDALVQAESGLVQIQGKLLANLSFIDAAAGLALTSAIMASIIKRDRTGQIDHIDMNLFDTALYLQSAPILQYSVTGKMLDQAAQGGRNPLANIFEAADGPLYMGLYWEQDWGVLCEVAGQPDLATHPDFATAADRSRNVAKLRKTVEQLLSSRPRRAWIDALEARGLLAGEVRRIDQVLASDQVTQSDAVQYRETSEGVRGAYVAGPAWAVGQQAPAAVSAPRIGQDTDAVLDLIGVTSHARRDLRDRGVVA